jgi:hypothetical protein
MVVSLLRIYTLGFFLVFIGSANAQKDILINDSLAAHADMLKVKMGGQGLGKMWKFRFGDYSVVSSKKGWTTGSITGNLFHTKTESKTTDKFSFILSNKTNDSAWVNAASNIQIQSLQQIEILPNFYWGENELVRESRNFSAFINVNRDTIETWALFMNVARVHDKEASYEAFLTNGSRRIFISPASGSKKNSKNPFAMDAAGYELFENSESLCAVQYRGTGAMAFNSNIVWISRNLDDHMKFILAAALTAILQLKTTETTEQVN